eukprot:Skav232213  [mRNA]  locus=scaffold2626:392842:403352:+ [translate_table: standard]
MVVICRGGYEACLGRHDLPPFRERFQTPASHVKMSHTKVFEVGFTSKTGEMLIRRLSQFFEPKTYDQVLKNCNSFTDCALAYLLSKRLPLKYYGELHPSSPGMSCGCQEKPGSLAAVDFNLEAAKWYARVRVRPPVVPW